MHDMYSPLINRRLDYGYVKNFLETAGFEKVQRIKDHPELFIRAIKSDYEHYKSKWLLQQPQPPFWFQRHQSRLTRYLIKK